MLKIGEFSKLSRVSIRMLRRYNEVGLLLPAETDPITGYRYYSEDQLPAAGRITALRDMGFGLAAIEQLLATWEEPVALEAILDQASPVARGVGLGPASPPGFGDPPTAPAKGR